MSANLPVTILLTVLGLFFLLLAVLQQRLLRRIGLKPLSEVFTNPGFQRSARLTETLGRLFLGALGGASLIQAAGTQFLSNPAVEIASVVLAGLAGAILLGVFGVVLYYWKAK